MKEAKLVILFSGNGSNMQNIIEALHEKKYLDKSHKEVRIFVSACISNNPNAYGIKRCQDLGIKCEVIPHKNFESREAFDRALVEQIIKYKPDLSILAGFMRVLSLVFTSQIRSINIHPSFLPHHKGANAIKDSYESNDKYGGVSVHWVDEILDSGAIILQEMLPKISGESLESFEKRIHQLEYKLYPKAILKALDLVVENA